MRSLLDVNVVIALLDPDHVFHERAHEWWADHDHEGWASCPVTENGVVRIMSHDRYGERGGFSPADLIGRLSTFARETAHQFWPDDVSLRDAAVFAADHIHGSRQVTDLYLLALATAHEGRLATFDTSIARSAVPAATPDNLVVL